MHHGIVVKRLIYFSVGSTLMGTLFVCPSNLMELLIESRIRVLLLDYTNNHEYSSLKCDDDTLFTLILLLQEMLFFLNKLWSPCSLVQTAWCRHVTMPVLFPWYLFIWILAKIEINVSFELFYSKNETIFSFHSSLLFSSYFSSPFLLQFKD